MLKIPVQTVKDYCSYLETAALIRSIERLSQSPDDRTHQARKFYLYDTGIKTLITGYCDLGPLAENAVFSHMMRQGISPCYWAEGDREVDFVLRKKDEESALLPIEIKYVDEFSWQDSLYNGLKLFLHHFPGTKRALIVTRDCDVLFFHETTEINVVPLWRFLLHFDAHDHDSFFLGDKEEHELFPRQEHGECIPGSTSATPETGTP